MPLMRFALAAAMLAGSALPSLAKDLVLERYFHGRTYAYGKFSAINGVSRRFHVVLTGKSHAGRTFTLQEDFRYDDGERDTKTWTFVRIGPKTYTGTREDVVGRTTVTLDGSKARFSYLVDLDPGEKKKVVRFHDTLALQDDGTLLNSSWVSKFIFPVAWVHVNFAPSEAAARAIRP